jgi:hypothetical protein
MLTGRTTRIFTITALLHLGFKIFVPEKDGKLSALQSVDDLYQWALKHLPNTPPLDLASLPKHAYEWEDHLCLCPVCDIDEITKERGLLFFEQIHDSCIDGICLRDFELVVHNVINGSDRYGTLHLTGERLRLFTSEAEAQPYLEILFKTWRALSPESSPEHFDKNWMEDKGLVIQVKTQRVEVYAPEPSELLPSKKWLREVMDIERDLRKINQFFLDELSYENPRHRCWVDLALQGPHTRYTKSKFKDIKKAKGFPKDHPIFKHPSGPAYQA